MQVRKCGLSSSLAPEDLWRQMPPASYNYVMQSLMQPPAVCVVAALTSEEALKQIGRVRHPWRVAKMGLQTSKNQLHF